MTSQTNNIVSSGSATPSLKGGKGWVSFLKILIAVLTALAGSIGVVSCTLMR